MFAIDWPDEEWLDPIDDLPFAVLSLLVTYVTVSLIGGTALYLRGKIAGSGHVESTQI